MSTSVTVGTTHGFNEDDSRYKSCCGMFPAKTGAYIISVFNLIMAILALISAIIAISNVGFGPAVPGLIVAIISLIIAGLLVAGLYKNKPMWILPALILMGIYCIILIISLLVTAGSYIYYMATATEEDKRNYEAKQQIDKLSNKLDPYGSQWTIRKAMADWGIAGIIGALIYTAIMIWLTTVVLAAYRYVKERAAAGYSNVATYQHTTTTHTTHKGY